MSDNIPMGADELRYHRAKAMESGGAKVVQWTAELRDLVAMHPDAQSVTITRETFDKLAKKWCEMQEEKEARMKERAQDRRFYEGLIEDAVQSAIDRLTFHFFRAKRDAAVVVKEAKAQLPAPRNDAEKAVFERLVASGEAEMSPEEAEKWTHGQDKLLGRPAGVREYPSPLEDLKDLRYRGPGAVNKAPAKANWTK